MDKEFEVLEEIGNIDLGDNPYKKFDRNKLKNVYGVEFATLYNALTELKAIKEAESSEAMKNFKCMKQQVFQVDDDFENYANKVEQYLLKARAQEKELAEYKEALRIIFERQVDMSLLKSVGSYIDYNEAYLRIKGFTFSKGKLLTQEEFDLLKRYFEKIIQKQ